MNVDRARATQCHRVGCRAYGSCWKCWLGRRRLAVNSQFSFLFLITSEGKQRISCFYLSNTFRLSHTSLQELAHYPIKIFRIPQMHIMLATLYLDIFRVGNCLTQTMLNRGRNHRIVDTVHDERGGPNIGEHMTANVAIVVLWNSFHAVVTFAPNVAQFVHCHILEEGIEQCWWPILKIPNS